MKQEENYHQNICNMYRVYFFLSLVCLSQAQIPSFGFCPEYVPMANFDMERFLGKWYEAERYFQFSEVAARCVVTDYAVAPNGKIYVSNEVTNRFTGVKRVIGGSLDVSGGKKTEGKLVVKYNTTPLSTTSTLTILDTDYDNYAVIWSCYGIGPVNTQSAWLMTRERIPDATTLQTAYGVLDQFKISRTFFVKTDQEGCSIAASDLNAALGIASTSTNVEQNAEADGSKKKNPPKLRAQPVAAFLFDSSKKDEAAEIDSNVKTVVEETKPVETSQKLPLKSTEKNVIDNSEPEPTLTEEVPKASENQVAIEKENLAEKDLTTASSSDSTEAVTQKVVTEAIPQEMVTKQAGDQFLDVKKDADIVVAPVSYHSQIVEPTSQIKELPVEKEFPYDTVSTDKNTVEVSNLLLKDNESSRNQV